MGKKIPLIPILGLVLFLLGLFAGFLATNSFEKSNHNSHNITPIQNSSSSTEIVNPSRVGSEEAMEQTSTPNKDPYPAPTELPAPIKFITPTPTTEIFGILPPLTPYPTPGPFKNMRVIYRQFEKPGYWINGVDGNEERALTGWWSTAENARKFDRVTFKPSPAGDYLLFSAFNNTNFYEPVANSFWVNKPDGSQPLIKITANDEWFPENPIWSPDGKQIAYRRTYFNKSNSGDLITGKGFEIWTMNNDGSSEKKIFSDPEMWVTSFGGDLPLFQWLYNGYIYFAVNDPGTLYAVSPTDGIGYELLDNIDAIQWRLSLLPDGQHLIQSIDVPFYNETPKWSADGKMVIFKEKDKTEKGKDRIILYDVVSGNRKEVLTLKEKDKLLSLSPDARFIAYLDETQALNVFDLTQNTTKLVKQGQVQTQQNNDSISFVDWVPVP